MKKVLLAAAILTLGALSNTSYARSSSYGPAYGGGTNAYACTYSDDGMVSVRAGAGTNYKTYDLIDNGTDVRIIGKRQARDGFVWYKISYGRIQGWARSDYICTN